MNKGSYTTSFPGGHHWSLKVQRGTTMKFTAGADRANVGIVFFNPDNLLERLNLPDTLKCQHTFKLTAGNCLYSDMGHIFASIIQDDLGWHDSVGGNLTEETMITKPWQPVSFQQAHNDRTQTGLDSFLIELAKYELGLRDLPANLNLFSKTTVIDAAGSLAYDPTHCKQGESVTLRFEMDTLVFLHTCPHPLDPSSEYHHRRVEIEIAKAEPIVTATDVCYNNSPENVRGFMNNRLYYLGQEASSDYLSDIAFIHKSGTSAKGGAFFENTPPDHRLLDSLLQSENAIQRTKIDAGDHYIAVVKKGQTVRIVDVEGNEAADTLFFNAQNTAEHYSCMNTVSSQKNLYLSTGTKLMSNRGNAMLTIVADTCGRHDTVGGACASESNTVRYDLERRHMHSCRDNWMLAVQNHPEFGLTKRDIAHNINFFMNVPVTPEGQLEFADGVSGPGKYVEMRAEMDVIVLISNCPQLNNPCSGYSPTPLEVLVWET